MSKISHAKILTEMKIFYEPFFQEWNKLYESLLQPNQHCAVLNKYFKSANELIHSLKLNTKEIVLDSNTSSKHLKSDTPAMVEHQNTEDTGGLKSTKQYDLDFKPNNKYTEHKGLNIFTCSKFPPPQNMVHRKEIFPYYLMDLSSLLPVMSLDIQPTDIVLDMCSSPGGKAICILQLLSLEGQLVCNDFSKKRLIRLKKVINEYVTEKIQRIGHVVTTNWNGEVFGREEKSTFDKVLIDAPCSSERHVIQKDFQYRGWSRQKMKENAKLQVKLLLSGLKSVKPGGIVTYSTCSISPWENEEVVMMALLLANDDGIKVCPVEKETLMDNTVHRFDNDVFHIHENTSNGVLVLPSEFSNWGPMYFAGIMRLE